MEGRWKFLEGGGGGFLKFKFLGAMYGNKLEFPGGRGVQDKKPAVGGVWIFSGTAQWEKIIMDFIHTGKMYVLLWLYFISEETVHPWRRHLLWGILFN